MYAGKAIHFSGNHAGHLAGAQVPMVNGPCGLLADVHPDVAERDIFQAVALASMQENAVFAAAVNVFKVYIADMPRPVALFAVYRRHTDGFGFAPPLVREHAGVDVQVGKGHVFNVAAITQHQRDAAVGAGDNAVGDGDIAEVRNALGAKLDSGTGGGQRTVGDHNVLTRAKMCIFLSGLENDAVIGGFNMAIVDAHIAAVVGINAIAVDHFQVVQNADAINQHILAAHHMHGPERAAGQGDFTDGQVLHTFHQQHGNARVIGSLNKVMIDFAVKVFFGAIDYAAAADADILGILSHNEIILWLTVIFAVFVRGHFERCIAVMVAVGSFHFQEVLFVFAGFQAGAVLQVQLHMAVQQNGTAFVNMAARHQHPAAAGCRAGINGFLDGRAIVCGAITHGTILQNIINHDWPPWGVFRVYQLGRKPG